MKFEKVLSKSQLKDHYVEFKYNGVKVNIDNVTEDISKYIPVAFNSKNVDDIKTNGSRAMMDNVAEDPESIVNVDVLLRMDDPSKVTSPLPDAVILSV